MEEKVVRMRNLFFVLIITFSPLAISSPIKYSFEGYTSFINLNSGDHDPESPLIRDDGVVITNGDSFMQGHIVFDPDQVRSGAGGTGLGEVLSWSFSTQGLTYQGSGGGFHYLTFENSSFKYHDEIPTGGYGPDVAYMDFNFNGDPFALGADFFPVADFIGGKFFTSIDIAKVDDDTAMWGLEGKITDLQVDQWSVPAPSSIWIMAFGLLGIFFKLYKRKV